MQKIATQIFIVASLVFGVLGIALILTLPGRGPDTESDLTIFLQKALFITAFVVLSSFALSVAGKYLDDKKR